MKQGQCGLNNCDDVLRPTVNKALLLERVVQLAAGWEHSIARTASGKLYSWGCGYKDSRRGVVPPVLGLGHNEMRLVPERISFLDGVRMADVTCGWDHCLALDSKGRLYSWGSGQNGKLGHENEVSISAVQKKKV